MAETLVKEKTCNSCGADVRPNSVFCYNCGSAVAPEVPHSGNKTRKLSNDWFKDDLVEEKPEENVSEKVETEMVEDESETSAEEISESPGIEENAEGKVEEPESEKRDLSKMDSAANLRRRGKSIQKKRVEVVWEEHENAPNGWFILVAIILALAAVGIWFVAKSLE